MTSRSSSYEKKVFRTAVAVAVIIHVLVVFGLIAAGGVSSENKYKPLAVMDFAYYDPDGGQEGGGEGEEPSTGPVLGAGGPTPEPEAEPEPAETTPEPETSLTEESPEPEVEPEPTEAPEVLTSASEDAAPLPPPPVVKAEAKPKPKPKVKAKPKAAAPAEARPKAETRTGGGGAARPGEVKPGGGKGKGRGGTGGGPGIGNPNALNAYAAKVRAKLNRLKKYPPAASSKKISGVVTVNFTVNRQGAVTSARLTKSSGHAVLDQEVMALVKRCSPFPAMPKELTQSTLNLTVPISFSPGR